jgi:hypothetical protein
MGFAALYPSYKLERELIYKTWRVDNPGSIKTISCVQLKLSASAARI